MPRHPCMEWFCQAFCCCCLCCYGGNDHSWERVDGPKEERMDDNEECFCCSDYFPRINRFCRTNLCCLCRCCCASWPRVVNKILERYEKEAKTKTERFEDKLRKAEAKEKDYRDRLTVQEHALEGLIKGDAGDHLISSQLSNIQAAARNLRQVQLRCCNARASCEYFQDRQDGIEQAIHTQDFISSAVPLANLLKTYGIGEKALSEDKAAASLGDSADIFSNINETVANVQKAIKNQRKRAEKYSKEESSTGEVLDVGMYCKHIQTKYGISSDLMTAGIVKANRKRLGMKESAAAAEEKKQKEESESDEETEMKEVEMSTTQVQVKANPVILSSTSLNADDEYHEEDEEDEDDEEEEETTASVVVDEEEKKQEGAIAAAGDAIAAVVTATASEVPVQIS